MKEREARQGVLFGEAFCVDRTDQNGRLRGFLLPALFTAILTAACSSAPVKASDRCRTAWIIQKNGASYDKKVTATDLRTLHDCKSRSDWFAGVKEFHPNTKVNPQTVLDAWCAVDDRDSPPCD